MSKLLSVLFVFTIITSVAQTITDSLESQLEKVDGKQKVILLNDLYKQYLNNNPVKALSYTRQALSLAEKLNDPSGMASSFNNMGVIYKNQGNLDKALKNYIAALQIQEENKFVDALAYTYSNVGTVYSLKREYDKALEYFNKANDQFQSIKHNLRIIGSLNNIGNVYEAKGDYDKALEFYLKSLKLYEELEDNSKAFVPFNNIGNIYFQKGDVESALAYYQSALDLERFNNDLNGQSNALHNIGSAYRKLGKSEEAISYFSKALNLAQETDNKRLLTVIYKSLAESYFTQGDMFMAYSFLSLHTTAKDSLYSEESLKQISSLESAYELEQKEAEIQSLKVQSQLQQLRIQNDNIIIIAGVLISLIGLGFAIIIYRENKVIKKNKVQLEAQKEELEVKNEIIEEKNQNITESIDYAKSVQKSLLNFSITDDKINNSFIFFRPKDIVSGDFYWYSEHDEFDIIVVADCTGHGVAGAFMTVVGVTALEQIINRDKSLSPAAILEQLNERVSSAFRQSNRDITDHGMDVAICRVDHTQSKITFSGANRPLFYFLDNELCEIKGTKRSIGNLNSGNLEFEEHEVNYKKGTMFYMTSDGYIDQFGGFSNKKFMLKRFRALLKNIYTKDLKEQKHIIKSEFERWKDDQEQTDDILVLGFKP